MALSTMTGIGDSAKKVMQESANLVLDVLPLDCVPVTACARRDFKLENDDLRLEESDDLRDDSESIDRRRSKSLLDTDPSFEDSMERSLDVNDASSVVATRESIKAETSRTTIDKYTPVGDTVPKPRPKAQFYKSLPRVQRVHDFSSSAHAVAIPEKSYTLRSFDAAARSNASWQKKVEALRALKYPSHEEEARNEVKEEREGAEESHNEPEPQEEQENEQQPHAVKEDKTNEDLKQAKSRSFDEQPKSIMKTTESPSSRKSDKAQIDIAMPADVVKPKPIQDGINLKTIEENMGERNEEYNSDGSCDQTPNEENVIMNLDNLHKFDKDTEILKNPDYHPVGEPIQIKHKPSMKKKIKKPIFGFLKRRKGGKKEKKSKK